MYLGNSSMEEEKTYFLPLLSLLEEKAQNGDEASVSKVESLSQLPKIQIITNKASYNLPPDAKSLFSHGGYKLALTTTEADETILAIRDIESPPTGGTKSDTPFLLVIVGSSNSEKEQLEKVAVFVANHLDTFSNKISGLFTYDADKNGISFDIRSMTNYLVQISHQSSNVLSTVRGPKPIGKKHFSWRKLKWRGLDVPLLVLLEGIDQKTVYKDLSLSQKTINFVQYADVIPLDNQEKLAASLLKRTDYIQSVLQKWILLSLINCIALIGVIILLIMIICEHTESEDTSSQSIESITTQLRS